MDKKQEEPLLHEFNQSNSTSLLSSTLIVYLLVAILVGIGSGFALSKTKGKLGPVSVNKITTTMSGEKGKTYGSDDTKIYKDSTEGTLTEGGIGGEGQFHLVRPGGDSQNVYLTSSIVDLSKFINKKIKVWGITQQAQKAGWLMDVGRVQVLE